MTLVAIAVVTGFAAHSARSLQIDADLAALLPETVPSVVNLRSAQDRFGGVGYVSVVLRHQGGDTEPLVDAGRQIAERLDTLDTIRWVELERPIDWFDQRSLLYLEPEDLETVVSRVEKRVRWEQQEHNPLFVRLTDEPPPSLDFTEIEARYRDRLGLDLDTTSGDEHGLDRRFMLSSDGRSLVILARPTGLASDLDFSRQVVADVEDELEAISLPPGISWDVSGRYKKKVDQQQEIEGDLASTSLLALALMLVFLGVHFRRVGAVVFVMAPLLIALCWTFGVAAALFGTLNILTAFVGTILLGLGIDHGIHLVSRHAVVWRDDPDDAVRDAFADTGLAVVVAGLTTIVAFGSLTLSEFGAFVEFGLTVSVGLALMVVGYFTVLPALLGIAHRVGWRPSPTSHQRSWLGQRLGRWAGALFWTAAVAAAWISTAAPQAQFDYDFAALANDQVPSARVDREVNDILGRSQTPLVLWAESPETEKALASVLRQRAEDPATGIDFVASTADLVPEDQDDKRVLLHRLEIALGKVKRTWLDEDDRRRFDRFATMARATPFERADLPTPVRRQFGTDETGSFVLVFASVSLSDGSAIVDLANEVRSVPDGRGGHVSAAGEAMVLADILETVAREAPVVLGVAGVAVFVCLWLLLGGLRRAAVAISPAAATIVVLVGMLGLTGLELNYLNMVILPALIGISVDGGVHLVSHLDRGAPAGAVLDETGRAIVGALLTTGLGFGVLAVASHPGLASLGELTLLGVAINLLACLLGVVAGVAMVRRFRHLCGATVGEVACTLVSTVGMAGFVGRGSGTLGALVALPIAGFVVLLVDPTWVPWVLAILVALSTPVAVAAVHAYENRRKTHDDQSVVVDELLGCLVALAFAPTEPLWMLGALVLFRVFDITKPWPIRAIDKWAPAPDAIGSTARTKFKFSVGVIADDLVAGIFAGLVISALRFFIL